MFEWLKKKSDLSKPLIAYDYKDIDLISHEISDIKSRNDINIWRDYEDDPLGSRIPLIAAPMVDVVNKHTCQEIIGAGGLAIVHRFQTVKQQIEHNFSAYYSIGISDDDLVRFIELYKSGRKHFCIDVANGANTNVVEFCDKIAGLYSDISLIVGNVQTYSQYKYLACNIPELKAVRIFVSPGAGCTSKNATGIYSPHVSTLLEFRNKPRINNVAIIADGGIREPGDFCKALAISADYVMAGSIFAACTDSPAKKITRKNGEYAVFSGSASAQIQQKYKDEPRYIEGKTIEVPVNGMTVSQLIKSYEEGLRSSMSYFGALNIDEYKQKANWIYKK